MLIVLGEEMVVGVTSTVPLDTVAVTVVTGVIVVIGGGTIEKVTSPPTY